MKTRSLKNSFKIVMVFSALLFPLAATAQNYSIDWYKVAGGGGTNHYSVTGGFWALISVMQTEGLPNLVITHSGNSVIVSWPATGSYFLQQNGEVVASAEWSTTGYPITTANGTNGTNSITINPPMGKLFFQLKQ